MFNFLQAAKYTERDRRLPHQDAAWAWAWSQLNAEEQEQFKEMFRADPEQSKVLEVPYYSQRDAANPADAPGMCYSSTFAMLLEYLKPGTLKGPNGDDQYLQRVRQFGQDTVAENQIKAMASYGVNVAFSQTEDIDSIEGEIDRGRPVPCGVLHHGPVNAPRGFGHWLLVIGYEQEHLIVHDPYGEMDLVNGGYINSRGRSQRYSKQNFRKRWSVAAQGDGSYRMVKDHGWMYRVA